jgi:hypothetical protein
VKIKDTKQLRAVFAAIEWNGKVSAGMRQISRTDNAILSTTPKSVQLQYERELESEQ